MNSKTLLKCLCMCLAMFAILVNANAQDLKSILTGVAKAVVGDKATTSSSIIGTWKYVGPQCQFESENLLAKAGGEVAAKEANSKVTHRRTGIVSGGSRWMRVQNNLKSETWSEPAA